MHRHRLPRPAARLPTLTDASGYGLGAVFTQSPRAFAAVRDSNGVLPLYGTVVCVHSALCTRDQAKYGATVCELVAMVRAVRYISTYLRGTPPLQI